MIANIYTYYMSRETWIAKLKSCGAEHRQEHGIKKKGKMTQGEKLKSLRGRPVVKKTTMKNRTVLDHGTLSGQPVYQHPVKDPALPSTAPRRITPIMMAPLDKSSIGTITGDPVFQRPTEEFTGVRTFHKAIDTIEKRERMKKQMRKQMKKTSRGDVTKI